MNIQLFCNSSCQSSRGYELLINAPFVNGKITRVEIPDLDAKLPCSDFMYKYGTDKYPFIKVDDKIVPFNELHNFIKNDLKYLLSTFKIESVS